MPHQLESMFYRGEVPWHKLGTPVTEALTVEQAIQLAGLDWSVSVQNIPPIEVNGQTIRIDTKLIMRDDNGTKLGEVGPDYKPLQNAESFKFFNPFVQSGEATFETAGSLQFGKRIWILAKLNKPDSVIVPESDDRVAKYILLSNSHDGTLAIRVGFTPIRVVCANTLSLAHNSNASQLLRIKHRGNVSETLDRVQQIVNIANQRFEATAEQYKALANKQINAETLEKYVKIVFSQKTTLKQIEEQAGIVQVKEQRSNVLPKVTELFEHGRGNDMPGVKGTFWAAYNAVTEYIQYNRGTDEARRLDSTWFGPGQTLNQKALSTAIELVAA